MATASYPLPKPVRSIGGPYQGTHSKAFNQRGGSDNWESENAVDLPTPKGTPVYAVAAGTIGKQIGAQGGGRFAGLRVHLVTAGNEFYYAHLSKLVVKAGEQVQDGQLIGYSGVANGVAHLHFASKVGDPRDAFGNGTGNQQHPAPQAPTDTTAASPPSSYAQVVAPFNATPPPTALGVSAPDVQMPGSVDYSLNPHDAAIGLWSQVATQSDLVSPDTQAMLANAQIASGGVR